MKRNAKRIVAILMMILVLVPAAAMLVQGATTLDLPIVYVAGKYYHIYESDKTTQLYPLDPPIGETIKDNGVSLYGAYLAADQTGNWKGFADKILEVIEPRYERLKMDGNGNPRYGTTVIPNPTPKKKTSNFQLEDYTFGYDGRLDPYENAKLLNAFINNVLTVTGKSKVNLIGRCLGTTVISTYLTEYGSKKIETCIFYASAFNGVYMMDGFFSADIDIDYQMLMYYLSNGKSDEGGDFETIQNVADVLRSIGLLGWGVSSANQAIEKMAPYLFPRLILAIFGTWPGHWAMISKDAFDKAVKVTLKDKTTYKGLITKVKKYHDEVMSKFPTTLENCRKNGMRIAIVCKYNIPLIPLSPHSDMQADGTVELKTMSLGATAAEVGKTFSNAYIRLLKNGKNDKYLSKDLVVSAHTCQYPDYTWFIKNCPHGVYPSEINKMFMEIFHSSTQYTITTNTKFPQYVSYNQKTDKITPITGPDSGTADPSMTASSALFQNIAQWIINFIQQIMAFLGL